jgi:hypothetical protein
MPDLQEKVQIYQSEGWEVSEHGEDRVTMVRRTTGSLKAHTFIFILTFYTLGLANFLYFGKKYWLDAEKKVVYEDE